MDPLRLPPLNFDALPNPNARFNHSELPPISLHPQISPRRCNRQYRYQMPVQNIPITQSTPVLPSVSPLLQDLNSITSNRSSPVTSYQTTTMKTVSPSSSTSSPPTPPMVSSLLNPINPTTVPSIQHKPIPENITILPPNMPIAPIKRAVQTPKGIREVYTCPFPSCTRISSEHSNMKAHMRLHTGERPYVCRVASCRKSFRWKSSLTYHERALHSNSRPYQCISCKKSFVEKRKLRLHHQLCPAVRAARGEIYPYGKVTVSESKRIN